VNRVSIEPVATIEGRRSARRRWWGPAAPKTVRRIAFMVIFMNDDIVANSTPSGQVAISRSVSSSITPSYDFIRLPWKGGNNSLRSRRCGLSSSEKSEPGPSISPSALPSATSSVPWGAVYTCLTSAGLETTTLGPRIGRLTVKASP
jgi:hypothetical protein